MWQRLTYLLTIFRKKFLRWHSIKRKCRSLKDLKNTKHSLNDEVWWLSHAYNLHDVTFFSLLSSFYRQRWRFSECDSITMIRIIYWDFLSLSMTYRAISLRDHIAWPHCAHHNKYKMKNLRALSTLRDHWTSLANSFSSLVIHQHSYLLNEYWDSCLKTLSWLTSYQKSTMTFA